MTRRIVLLGALVLAVAIPAFALALASEAARTQSEDSADFIAFIGAIAILGGTDVAVGVTILWRKPGNRIGLLLAVGGLLVMSVFAAWPIAIIRSASGDLLASGLASWWGTVVLLPAVVLVFPAVGILFPDERLPGPRWRWPVAAGAVPLAVGTILQSVAPWKVGSDSDFTAPNPIAIAGVQVDTFAIGGGLAALGTFTLFAVAVAAVVVRYRRSGGVERAQQKWLVASVSLMAIAFPVSFATDIGPAELIDLASVAAGALVPVAVGIAVLRYHVFEIDRVVSRTIAYGLLTAILVATYAGVILMLQGPLGTVLGGDTVSVALSTLVAAALFQPLRVRLQRLVDRRFDRARFDAERTTAAFSERLRSEMDIGNVTADLDRTVRDALKPTTAVLWLRDPERGVS